MANIKAVLEQSGYPAARLVWKVKKGQEKPGTYYTFQRVTGLPAISADDEVKEETETYLAKTYLESEKLTWELFENEKISVISYSAYDICSCHHRFFLFLFMEQKF